MIVDGKVKLTYEEYRLFPDDGNTHELIDGEHHMAPGPGTYHQSVSRHIQFQLYRQLEEAGLPFPADMFYVWTYRRTFRAGDWRGGFALLAHSPRFRVVLARWLWSQATYRLGRTDAEPHRPEARSVTVTEIPWLLPILGPAQESRTPGHTDEPIQQTTGGVVGETSSVA